MGRRLSLLAVLARTNANQTLKVSGPLISPKPQYELLLYQRSCLSFGMGRLLTYVYQSIGWVSAPSFLLRMNIVPLTTGTLAVPPGSTYVIKNSVEFYAL